MTLLYFNDKDMRGKPFPNFIRDPGYHHEVVFPQELFISLYTCLTYTCQITVFFPIEKKTLNEEVNHSISLQDIGIVDTLTYNDYLETEAPKWSMRAKDCYRVKKAFAKSEIARMVNNSNYKSIVFERVMKEENKIRD